MPTYITRLLARSVARLNRLRFVTQDGTPTFVVESPKPVVAVVDRLVPVGEFLVPDGLLIQVEVDADDINTAADRAVGIATGTLSVLACAGLAAIDPPRPLWIYDATPGVVDRDYRHFAYDAVAGYPPTRSVEHANFDAVMKGYFDWFATNPRPDWLARVERAIHAFRRGLADNADLLSEFLTAWSSMEGLDCVYRGRRPSPHTRNFLDGIRDVLSAVGHPEIFDLLHGLRNGLAHGNVSLADAIRLTEANIDHVRRAFVLMILRTLGVEEATAARVSAQEGLKGSVPSCFRLIATIRFEPVDVRRFDTQPIVEATFAHVEAAVDGDKFRISPTWNWQPKNVDRLTAKGYEIWGDFGIAPAIEHRGVSVIRGGANNLLRRPRRPVSTFVSHALRTVADLLDARNQSRPRK